MPQHGWISRALCWKRSQTQQATYCIVLFIGNSRNGKTKVSEGRSGVLWGWGRRGHKETLGGNGNILWPVVLVTITLYIIQNSLNCVKNCKVCNLRFQLYFQANKVDCHSFKGTSKRHETSEWETRDFYYS
jgi:hypothetical protein